MPGTGVTGVAKVKLSIYVIIKDLYKSNEKDILFQ